VWGWGRVIESNNFAIDLLLPLDFVLQNSRVWNGEDKDAKEGIYEWALPCITCCKDI
jgi:hypothetical protein